MCQKASLSKIQITTYKKIFSESILNKFIWKKWYFSHVPKKKQKRMGINSSFSLIVSYQDFAVLN